MAIRAFVRYRAIAAEVAVSKRPSPIISRRGIVAVVGYRFVVADNVYDRRVVLHPVEDVATASDATAMTVNKALEDTVGTEDSVAMTVNKALQDSASPADSVAISVDKVLADNVTANDATAMTLDKVLADTVAASDSVFLTLYQTGTGALNGAAMGATPLNTENSERFTA